MFSIVNASASTLNSDLLKTQDWVCQRKMSFNPNQTKQTKKSIFSRKKNTTTHPPLFFNDSEIKFSLSQLHLEITLDSKLLFNENINGKIRQSNKGAGLLQKLQTILPRTSLLTIYKSFTRPLLDYVVIAKTWAIKDSSHEKLYQDLGLEYLYQRR